MEAVAFEQWIEALRQRKAPCDRRRASVKPGVEAKDLRNSGETPSRSVYEIEFRAQMQRFDVHEVFKIAQYSSIRADWKRVARAAKNDTMPNGDDIVPRSSLQLSENAIEPSLRIGGERGIPRHRTRDVLSLFCDVIGSKLKRRRAAIEAEELRHSACSASIGLRWAAWRAG